MGARSGLLILAALRKLRPPSVGGYGCWAGNKGNNPVAPFLNRYVRMLEESRFVPKKGHKSLGIDCDWAGEDGFEVSGGDERLVFAW